MQWAVSAFILPPSAACPRFPTGVILRLIASQAKPLAPRSIARYALLTRRPPRPPVPYQPHCPHPLTRPGAARGEFFPTICTTAAPKSAESSRKQAQITPRHLHRICTVSAPHLHRICTASAPRLPQAATTARRAGAWSRAVVCVQRPLLMLKLSALKRLPFTAFVSFLPCAFVVSLSPRPQLPASSSPPPRGFGGTLAFN
jgi:hypothetical protein